VPQNLVGKKVTLKSTFNLGPLNPGGKIVESAPVQVQL